MTINPEHEGEFVGKGTFKVPEVMAICHGLRQFAKAGITAAEAVSSFGRAFEALRPNK